MGLFIIIQDVITQTVEQKCDQVGKIQTEFSPQLYPFISSIDLSVNPVNKYILYSYSRLQIIMVVGQVPIS